MSDDCSLQNKQYEIQEARCIIPLLIKKGGSWFCDYYDNEENCPILKRLGEEKNSRT